MSTGPGEIRLANASESSRVLAMNRGSSSLKGALYSFGPGDRPTLLLAGKVDRIGQPQASFTVNDLTTGRQSTSAVEAPGHGEAAGHLLDWLEQWIGVGELAAVGHRVVHGGPRYSQPERISPELLDELRHISPFDPDHLPMEIAMIEAVARRAPSCRRWPASIRPSIGRCRGWRGFYPFPANTTGRASSATAFTACRMPI